MHYLVHVPEQLRQFGPLRFHWCMRFEAKNGFFKQKRWFNFINLAKSLCSFHKNWVCMLMMDNSGYKCRNCLHEGNLVKKMFVVSVTSYPELFWLGADACENVTLASSVIQDNIFDQLGDVLLCHFPEEGFPEFVVIKEIILSNEKLFIKCQRLNVLCFKPIVNAFAVESSNSSFEYKEISNLLYKWPQINRQCSGSRLVMLKNVDKSWIL